MFLDRLSYRVQITLFISLLVHLFILSLFGLQRFSRSGKAVMLTEVEYFNEQDKPFGVREKNPPKPPPKEIVDLTKKLATAEIQAPSEPESIEETEEEGDPNALPYDPNEESGKIFLPFYAVEQLPAFQNKIMPIYPEEARKLERSSDVILEAYIDAQGIVRKIRIIRSGGGQFDQAAIRALETSRFKPARINGKPVPVKILVPYVFTLEK